MFSGGFAIVNNETLISGRKKEQAIFDKVACPFYVLASPTCSFTVTENTIELRWSLTFWESSNTVSASANTKFYLFHNYCTAFNMVGLFSIGSGFGHCVNVERTVKIEVDLKRKSAIAVPYLILRN